MKKPLLSTEFALHFILSVLLAALSFGVTLCAAQVYVPYQLLGGYNLFVPLFIGLASYGCGMLSFLVCVASYRSGFSRAVRRCAYCVLIVNIVTWLAFWWQVIFPSPNANTI